MLARSLRQPNGHFISLQEHIEPGPLECAPRDKRNYMTSSGCRTRTRAQSWRPFGPPWLYKLGKNRNLCAVAFIETNAGQPDGALSALALSEHFKSICLFIKSRYWAGIPLPGANASELAGISHLSSRARYGQFWQLNLSLAFVFWPHAVRLDLSLRVWECSVVSLWRVGVTGVVRFLPKCSLRFNAETCQAVRHPQQIIAKNWTVDKSPLKRRHSSCQCFAKKVYNHEITSTHVFKSCCNEGVIRHIYTYVYVKYLT